MFTNYIDDIGLIVSKKKAVHALQLDFKAKAGYIIYHDEKLGWCQCRAIDQSYQANKAGDKSLALFRQAQWSRFAGEDTTEYSEQLIRCLNFNSAAVRPRNAMKIETCQYDFKPSKTYYHIVDNEGRTYHHKDRKWRKKCLKEITTYRYVTRQAAEAAIIELEKTLWP